MRRLELAPLVRGSWLDGATPPARRRRWPAVSPEAIRRLVDGVEAPGAAPPAVATPAALPRAVARLRRPPARSG